MNEVQRLELEILKKFDEVCQAHGLQYYIAYGTCVGAVRHKGFVPWDHDIDVLMPIKDAKELSKYQSEFGNQYFVANYQTDQNYKNTNMQIIDKKHRCRVVQKGREEETIDLAMDIYPFYACPSTKIGLLFNIWRSHIHKMLVMGPPKNHGKALALASKIILLFYQKKNRERDIARIEKKLDYKGPSYEIADYFGKDITLCSAITYNKEWFGKPIKMDFEGLQFDGPTDADKYLTKRYGDYMTPPSRAEIEEEAVLELI